MATVGISRKWALLAMLLVGSEALRAQSAASAIDPSWVVPAAAAQRQNPMRSRPDTALGGGKIFDRNCVMCHGDTTHEQKNHAPDLSSAAVQMDTDGALFWRISQGNSRRGMPSFSSIPETQRWQLVLYIRSLSREATLSK
jgi:mono/diheme cytochrome c family protein